MTGPDHVATVRAYYRALDDHAYDRLSSLLAPTFVQRRPDRTFESRDAFVEFMREDRPVADSTHVVERVYRPVEDGAAPDGTESGDSSTNRILVEGRVLGPDDDLVVRFVDVHVLRDGRIDRVRTYAR